MKASVSLRSSNGGIVSIAVIAVTLGVAVVGRMQFASAVGGDQNAVARPPGASGPALPSPGVPKPGGLISAEDARTALARIEPRAAEIPMRDEVHRSGRWAYEFAGQGFDAFVDETDGHVMMLSKPIPNRRDVDPAISETEAASAADAYLTSIASPIDGLDRTVVPGTGAGIPGYTVSYQRHLGEINLPDYRSVEVDGLTGDVLSFVDVRVPYVTPDPPTIDRHAAEAKALASVDDAIGATSDLVLTFDATGTQRLLWQVALKRPGEEGPVVVFLDSYDGSVAKP